MWSTGILGTRLSPGIRHKFPDRVGEGVGGGWFRGERQSATFGRSQEKIKI